MGGIGEAITAGTRREVRMQKFGMRRKRSHCTSSAPANQQARPSCRAPKRGGGDAGSPVQQARLADIRPPNNHHIKVGLVQDGISNALGCKPPTSPGRPPQYPHLAKSFWSGEEGRGGCGVRTESPIMHLTVLSGRGERIAQKMLLCFESGKIPAWTLLIFTLYSPSGWGKKACSSGYQCTGSTTNGR